MDDQASSLAMGFQLEDRSKSHRSRVIISGVNAKLHLNMMRSNFGKEHAAR
jgi:hypothetical protein